MIRDMYYASLIDLSIHIRDARACLDVEGGERERERECVCV